MEELLSRPPPDEDSSDRSLELEPVERSPSEFLEHSLTPGERSEPLPPSEPLAHYEELEVLGSGGTGVVTLARDRQSGERFAIKRLRRNTPSLARRFQREAETIASLDHPGIVRLIRVEGAEGGLALIFELVDGPSLEELVRQRGRLELAHAVEVVAAVADALAYAHERGVVHRDVKPTNVIMDPAGRPKLIDFGLALPLETLQSITPSGEGPCGTWDYMAPEQWRSAREVDARADVYALGATLYRLLTGNSPRVIRERRIPELARELVLQAVEEDPADRFDDMSAFHTALLALHERARRDASGVHTPLERIARRLREDLAQARSRKSARRLVVAASGLTALGLLPPEAARNLGAHLAVGAPLEEELALLVDSLVAGGEHPRLLGDAHAILVAALRADELTERGRADLRRLATAAREPRRERPSARLAKCVERLTRRGALARDDLRLLAANRGPTPQILEELLVALRTHARTSQSWTEWRVHEARWRHALSELAAALPDEELAPRIQRELLAVELERLAREQSEEND